MELLLALAAIILVIAIQRLHLAVAPAAVMVVLMAAEVGRRALPVCAATKSVLIACGAAIALSATPIPRVCAAILAIVLAEPIIFVSATSALGEREVPVAIAAAPAAFAVVTAAWCLVKFTKIAVGHANLCGAGLLRVHGQLEDGQ